MKKIVFSLMAGIVLAVAAFGAGSFTSSGPIGADSADANCCWTWEWPED